MSNAQQSHYVSGATAEKGETKRVNKKIVDHTSTSELVNAQRRHSQTRRACMRRAPETQTAP